MLVFGHTHKPWIDNYGDVLFVNCGSVGKPKDGDPRAAFAVLEAERRDRGAAIERVEYDTEAPPARWRGRASRRVRREAVDRYLGGRQG